MSGDARTALLAGLIDHAPTFPPASLAPDAALTEDRRARESAERALLARLVWPASRLGELGDEKRELSLVLDDGPVSDPRVAAVELRRPQSLDGIAGPTTEVYVELPLDGRLADELEALAARGLRAKVRCGGAAVPSVDELAKFLRACRERRLPFKATAGLHHAVRTEREHGFLNLLAAVVFGDEQAALAEQDPGAFALTTEAFAWRDRRAGPDELARARRERLRAIGSCSFFEPVEELRALGMLPA
ncbi:MAG: hypothetical protein ICV64_09795 [Thermoleophilia bacterium]|nr:hypothetical protein [Thermoleophilia bacterium]